MSIMSPPSFSCFSFSVRFARNLALRVVDNTAVSTFSTALSCFVAVGGGYANKDGLAFETNSNLGIYVRAYLRLSTFKSELRPMMAVGVNAKDKQCAKGYQYQKLVNR